MLTPTIVMETDRLNRTIVFHVREGFGNGCDASGVQLLQPDAEITDSVRMFKNALESFYGKSTKDRETWISVDKLMDNHE